MEKTKRINNVAKKMGKKPVKKEKALKIAIVSAIVLIVICLIVIIVFMNKERKVFVNQIELKDQLTTIFKISGIIEEDVYLESPNGAVYDKNSEYFELSEDGESAVVTIPSAQTGIWKAKCVDDVNELNMTAEQVADVVKCKYFNATSEKGMYCLKWELEPLNDFDGFTLELYSDSDTNDFDGKQLLTSSELKGEVQIKATNEDVKKFYLKLITTEGTYQIYAE